MKIVKQHGNLNTEMYFPLSSDNIDICRRTFILGGVLPNMFIGLEIPERQEYDRLRIL